MPASVSLLIAFLALAIVVSAHPYTGCKINGTMYGEGSATVAPSLCEYCYCIKGKQHCVRPHCLLNVPGCDPEYSQHSCCPVKYNCSDMRNPTATSTTTASSLSHIPGRWCKVNETTYPEGEKVVGHGKHCENCYCVKGEVRCEQIICALPVDGCTPVIIPGHCCPSSYNCSSNESSTIIYSLKGDNVRTESSSPGTTILTECTTNGETTEGTTFDSPSNDTELRSGTEHGITGEETTTAVTTTTMETTTLLESVKNSESNASSPVHTMPDVLEAIINRTLAKDEDYEYDYNEPSLPPSLPNLKIIPFVAADAVVDHEEYSSHLEGKTEIPIYLDIPQPNRFSPPSKTEGGFVPRDPVIDGPFYESKFEKPFTNNEPQTELTSETLLPPITEPPKLFEEDLTNNEPQTELTSETLLPPITEPPKLFEEGRCESDGHTYHHGQVVSELNACELCVCYFKKIHCQKPKCNPVKSGCHRVHDDNSGCCGQELCGSSIDNHPANANVIETASSTTPLPETMSNIPAITVADLVVTPNPFKDVIRTEPAPNLVDIMKDMLPHILNDTSVSKPLTPDFNSALKNNVSNNYSQGKDSTDSTASKTAEANIIQNTNNTNLNHSNNEYLKNSTKEQNDYEDTFSLSSVFDMLFRGNGPASNTAKPTVLTTTPHNYVYDIHETGQKQDINNAIENLDGDYFVEKNKVLEKANDLSILNDYQADESRNDTSGVVDSQENSEVSKPTTNSTDSDDLKSIKDDIASGLLKLAGCNIYGRMYRVGRIISELSGPCLECMCTEFGVQCRKLC